MKTILAVLLASLSVLFLAAWGAVTFFAVKLAILSAARVQPKIGIPLQV
ncbi:MAG TPA: hypothetical protein VGJ78_05550 [Vicinamibacterales bacterium]|jgi:hypothetical protein